MQGQKGPYRLPPPLYHGQDTGVLVKRLPQATGADGVPVVPAVRLDFHTVRNGWFVVGDGLDGLVLTADRRLVRFTGMFSDPSRADNATPELAVPVADIEFESVFVGFDAAWMNWFHWVCFAMARSALAAGLLPPSCPIILPDYAVRPGTTEIRFSEATWRQSLQAFGLNRRVTLLPPGLYHAREIRFPWTRSRQPTDLTLLDAFQDLFRAVRRRLPRRSDLPRRVFILREAGRNQRITAEESALLDRVAERYGFVRVSFESMDFMAQMEIMWNAEAVIGVHGAGLTNLLFAGDRTKIIEINLPLDSPIYLRPWMYLLAHGRRLPYNFLNSAAGDLTETRLAAAFDSLGLG